MRRKRSSPYFTWGISGIILLYALFQFHNVHLTRELIKRTEQRIHIAKRTLALSREKLEEARSSVVLHQSLNLTVTPLPGGASAFAGRSPRPVITTNGSATSLDWSARTAQFKDGPFGKPREGEGVIYVLGLHGALIESYVQRWNGRGPYLRELLRSVRSLKLNSPNTRVSLITDEPHIPTDIAEMFEHVIVHQPKVKVGWGHKIPGLLKTPYVKTLFLDADTVVCWPLDDMFTHLNHTQLGVVIEPGLYNEHLQMGFYTTRTFWYMPWVLGHQLNSGMLLYRADPSVLSMYSAWHADFTQKDGKWAGKAQTDQGFLAHIVDRTRAVKYIYLPPEYNMRVHANTFPHYVKGPVYVLHSRYAECGIVNERLGPRLFDFRKNTTVYWYAATPDAAAHVPAGSGAEYSLRSYCACDVPFRHPTTRTARACGVETDLAAPSTMFTIAQYACVNQTSMYADDDS